MRLFLAIDVPLSVKKKVSSALAAIKNEYPHFRWVSEKNYHITVYFFGETNKLEKIKKQLETLLYDGEKFYLYSTRVDLFITNEITIYLNFRREKKLENMAEKIAGFFSGGILDDKKFLPHLTLARCRVPSKQQYFVLKKRLSRLSVDIDFPVSKLVLFQSILDQEKPIYKKITSFPLNEG